MAKLPTRAELEAKQAFINNKPDESLWDIKTFKNKSIDELIEQLDSINQQFSLVRWRIWWEIKKKVGKDTQKFNQLLKELRVSDRTNCLIESDGSIMNDKKIQRAWKCGRICELLNIENINKTKIRQQSILLLEQIDDDDAIKRIFKEIKGKNITSVKAVQEVIDNELKVVHTIEQKVDVIDSEPKPSYIVPVIDSIAQEKADIWLQQEWPNAIESEAPAQYLASGNAQLSLMVDDDYESRIMDILDHSDLRTADKIALLSKIIQNLRNYPQK